MPPTSEIDTLTEVANPISSSIKKVRSLMRSHMTEAGIDKGLESKKR